MSTQEHPSNQQLQHVMTHRWLAHSIRKWLEQQGTPPDSYTPDQVYLAAKDAMQDAGPDARMEDMLEKAKRDWQAGRDTSQAEAMGHIFREWLAQRDIDIPAHPRRYYTIAAVLNDVCHALPDAPINVKMEAIKALWTAHRNRLLAQPAAEA